MRFGGIFAGNEEQEREEKSNSLASKGEEASRGKERRKKEAGQARVPYLPCFGVAPAETGCFVIAQAETSCFVTAQTETSRARSAPMQVVATPADTHVSASCTPKLRLSAVPVPTAR